MEKLHFNTNLSLNKSKTEIITINWANFDPKGIKIIDHYKYLGVQIYNTLRSKERQNEIKQKKMRHVGIYSTKIAILPMHIQKILLCSNIKSIYEYHLQPLILS